MQPIHSTIFYVALFIAVLYLCLNDVCKNNTNEHNDKVNTKYEHKIRSRIETESDPSYEMMLNNISVEDIVRMVKENSASNNIIINTSSNNIVINGYLGLKDNVQNEKIMKLLLPMLYIVNQLFLLIGLKQTDQLIVFELWTCNQLLKFKKNCSPQILCCFLKIEPK